MTATAKDMCRALYGLWAPKWAVLFEVTATPDLPADGYGRRLSDEGRPRRIDALAMRPTRPRYAGDGWERLAVEVKVSRSDFLADVRDPHKQALWRSLTHAFAYAAPAGLIRLDELPEGVGLVEVGKQEWYGVGTGWTRRAKWKPEAVGPLPQQVLTAIGGRLSRAEALGRGYIGSGAGADVAELRATVERLRTEVDNAHRAADRERDIRMDWQRRYAAVGDPPCDTCGQPLRARGGRRGYGWEHRAEHEMECHRLRAAAELERRPNASYRYVPEPQPVERLESVG